LLTSTALIFSTVLMLTLSSTLSSVFKVSDLRPDVVLPAVFFISLRRHWLSALGHILVLSYLQDVYSGTTAGLHLFSYVAVFVSLKIVNPMINLRPRSVKAIVGAVAQVVSMLVEVLAASFILHTPIIRLLSAGADRMPGMAVLAAIMIPLLYRYFSKLDHITGHGGPGKDHDIPREARRLTTGRILLPDETGRGNR